MCPSRELSDRELWRPWEREARFRDLSHSAPTQNGIARTVSFSSSLSCPICFKCFKRDSELRRHQNSKHLKKVEKCKICNKDFTRKDNLTRHQKMAHIDKGKPSCQFCKKPLSRRDAVQRHESRCPKNSSRLDRQLQQQEDVPMPIRDDNDDDEPLLTLTHIERLSLKYPKLNANTSDEDCSDSSRD